MKEPGKTYEHLYGPVPSRRLGQSLGVDIVPFKVCSYSCIYCQLGTTPETTLKRDEYIPCKEIIHEIADKVVEQGFKADWITIGGSGEPTLNSSIGTIISGIKDITSIPVAVITNGSLFHQKSVRQEVMQADLVLPSLDSGSSSVFKTINRPSGEISFEKMVEGLGLLSREFQGRIWLEVFLVKGVNTDEADIRDIKSAISRIKPDKVHLNTAVRPPAEQFVKQLSAERMEQIRDVLGTNAEIIAGDISSVDHDKVSSVTKEEVLAFLQRRPGSLHDLSTGLRCHHNEMIQYIKMLLDEGSIIASRNRSELYYMRKT